MNLEGIKLTQEQVRCKNIIIDLAVTYLFAKDKLNKIYIGKVTRVENLPN